jgi:hypothetical protein
MKSTRQCRVEHNYEVVRQLIRETLEGEMPSGLTLLRGDEIPDVEQKWLVPDFLPHATLSVIAGLQGIGKTTACLSLAASITRGQVPIIGGVREPGIVLMLTNEDSPAHIRRAFARLGGDLTRLYVESDQGLPWGLDDCASLEDTLREMRPALVIIDSFFSHVGSKVDTNLHAEVVPSLLRLRKIAEEFECAIVLVHHANKSQSGEPLLKISGSMGITAIARHVLFVGKHPDDENLRVAGIAKSNLARASAPSMAFKIDPFSWLGSSNIRASEILHPAAVSNEGRLEEAIAFLQRELANGSRNATDMQKAASAAGIFERTLKRAKSKAHVASVKDPLSGNWIWHLPGVSQEGHEEGHEGGRLKGLAPLAPLATFDQSKNLLTYKIFSPDEEGQEGQILREGQDGEHVGTLQSTDSKTAQERTRV